MSGWVTLGGHDPAAYEIHEIHRSGSVYPETNCYTDVFIELTRSRGLEPLAALGSVYRMDFEGDQWTFFKPSPEDVELLLGIDIHEMQPYRPLAQQATEQIALDRTLIVEVDSYYLPDTASTAYRREHVKSSIAIEAVDEDAERLRYFHNTGLFELSGEDYRGVFRLGRPFSDDVLPPYCELARFDLAPPLAGDELRAAARERLARQLARRPRENPFAAFATGLQRTLPDLLAGDVETYHAYAFATVRMIGAGFQLGAAMTEWLFGDEGRAAIEPQSALVDDSKVLSFRLARRKPFDPAPALASMTEHWDQAMTRLDALVG